MTDFRKLSRDIGAAPLGDLIASVGRGVAEAQAALDAGSLQQPLDLCDHNDDVQKVLRDTGYRPTFYTIPETEGEWKLSLTITGRETVRPAPSGPQIATASVAPNVASFARRSLSKTANIYAAPVDGKYQNSYNFSSQVSATVKFKIVAVPPSRAAEEARVVPDLTGMFVQDAQALVDSFDLGLDPGAASPLSVITAQDLTPGDITSQGALITVTDFEDTA